MVYKSFAVTYWKIATSPEMLRVVPILATLNGLWVYIMNAVRIGLVYRENVGIEDILLLPFRLSPLLILVGLQVIVAVSDQRSNKKFIYFACNAGLLLCVAIAAAFEFLTLDLLVATLISFATATMFGLSARLLHASLESPRSIIAVFAPLIILTNTVSYLAPKFAIGPDIRVKLVSGEIYKMNGLHFIRV